MESLYAKKAKPLNESLKMLNEGNLVSISISRKNGEIQYKVDCSKGVSSEELAHYLDEIIEGICSWKPEVCQETIKTIVGTIKTNQSAH
jgi:hypothetical protein